jgi:hypothetical protein
MDLPKGTVVSIWVPHNSLSTSYPPFDPPPSLDTSAGGDPKNLVLFARAVGAAVYEGVTISDDGVAGMILDPALKADDALYMYLPYDADSANVNYYLDYIGWGAGTLPPCGLNNFKFVSSNYWFWFTGNNWEQTVHTEFWMSSADDFAASYGTLNPGQGIFTVFLFFLVFTEVSGFSFLFFC